MKSYCEKSSLALRRRSQTGDINRLSETEARDEHTPRATRHSRRSSAGVRRPLLGCLAGAILMLCPSIEVPAFSANCNPRARGVLDTTNRTAMGNVRSSILSRMFFSVRPPPEISTAIGIGEGLAVGKWEFVLGIASGLVNT